MGLEGGKGGDEAQGLRDGVSEDGGRVAESPPANSGASEAGDMEQTETAAQSDEILKVLANTIRSYPLNFREARILSGMEEAMYEWITINYILKAFPMIGMKEKIHGALDLGGASTQISFMPLEAISNKTTEAKFELFGYNYSIYTHSYLCYRKEESNKRDLAALLKDLTVPIENPCYLKGYMTSTTLDYIFGRPGKCQEIVKTLFNFTACHGSKLCAFNGVYQPPINGKFFAFSAFYYITEFFNLISKRASLKTSLVWRLLRNPKVPKFRLKNYCTDGWILLTLLVDGYKFDHSTWKNIKFQKKVAVLFRGCRVWQILKLTLNLGCVFLQLFTRSQNQFG
uniref:Ectonucleoside triphosphate diphosphohydrolase 8 n=1 Tax=Callorhinchus milii TaxID=7868 RepID=A0A4W3IZP6_CALMI